MPNHADQWPRPTKAKAPPRLIPAPPVSPLFPIDWETNPADWHELEANALEALLLLTRKRDRLLRRHEPLSKLGSFKAHRVNRPVTEMSAAELHLHIQDLRERAARHRAQAEIDAAIRAADASLANTNQV